MLLATGQSKRVSAADFAEFEKTSKAAGYTAVLQLAEFNPATQLSQAENALSEGVDVIVLQPVDPTTAPMIVSMAEAVGVPVIVTTLPSMPTSQHSWDEMPPTAGSPLPPRP